MDWVGWWEGVATPRWSGPGSGRASQPRSVTTSICWSGTRASSLIWSGQVPPTYRVRIGDPSPEVPTVFATLERRRRAEPSVAPVRVEGEGLRHQDPVARFEELRQTGVPYQLVPTPGGATARRDPITATAAVVVLAAVPLHDVGGGSRGAQLAQQLATQGAHVTYVYRFDAAESVDLGLRFVHPTLEERRWDEFDLESLLRRVTSPRRLALIEFPHPDYLPLVARLKSEGFDVVYDLIDDWADPALGSNWYRAVVESSLVDHADLLTASAASLQSTLADRSGRLVELIPNAVNPRLFDPTRTWRRPADLPPGPIFEYHGSLYGDWFDWDAVKSVAAAYPEATVVLIGDRPRPLPILPGNVLLLGLKRQSELAAYLAHTEVALIPFIVTPTTHAVSPLKVYEYLAMGVPVAAPPLQPIVDLAGVSTDVDLVSAVAAARSGPRPIPERSWNCTAGRPGRLSDDQPRLGTVGRGICQSRLGPLPSAGEGQRRPRSSHHPGRVLQRRIPARAGRATARAAMINEARADCEAGERATGLQPPSVPPLGRGHCGHALGNRRRRHPCRWPPARRWLSAGPARARGST